MKNKLSLLACHLQMLLFIKVSSLLLLFLLSLLSFIFFQFLLFFSFLMMVVQSFDDQQQTKQFSVAISFYFSQSYGSLSLSPFLGQHRSTYSRCTCSHLWCLPFAVPKGEQWNPPFKLFDHRRARSSSERTKMKQQNQPYSNRKRQRRKKHCTSNKELQLLQKIGL